MNSAHLHLIITHLPVLGTLFGLCLLLLAIVQKNSQLHRTSLWVLVLAGACAVPTYLTGRPASAVLVKSMPGISLDAGDQHAEIAVVALVLASLVAVVALLALLVFRSGRAQPRWVTGLVLLLAIGTTLTMIWTASLGGRIRHTEIQPASTLQAAH